MPAAPGSSGEVLLDNEAINASSEYNPAPGAAVRWATDGENYTALEASAKAADDAEDEGAAHGGHEAHDSGTGEVKRVREIVQYNAATGTFADGLGIAHSSMHATLFPAMAGAVDEDAEPGMGRDVWEPVICSC